MIFFSCALHCKIMICCVDILDRALLNHGLRSFSPENSNQRSVYRVSIIDVHVVPTAFCGKVVKSQPENRIWAAWGNNYHCLGFMGQHLYNIRIFFFKSLQRIRHAGLISDCKTEQKQFYGKSNAHSEQHWQICFDWNCTLAAPSAQVHHDVIGM